MASENQGGLGLATTGAAQYARSKLCVALCCGGMGGVGEAD